MDITINSSVGKVESAIAYETEDYKITAVAVVENGELAYLYKGYVCDKEGKELAQFLTEGYMTLNYSTTLTRKEQRAITNAVFDFIDEAESNASSLVSNE